MRKRDNKKAILIITDGIGYNESCEYNAFCQAKKPTYDYLFKNYPNSLIKTYGLSVGLPKGQMGNSEVGHMILGSGRVLYQDLVKINLSIENDTLKDNETLVKNLDRLKDNDAVHLIGLLSDGGVHSHINHIIALAKIAKFRSKSKKIFLHLITDGRDVYQKSAQKYIKIIQQELDKQEFKNIEIATIGGRFYGMDRDNRWDRVEKHYNTIINPSSNNINKKLDINNYIENSYSQDITDEFIIPTAFNNYDGVKKNDLIIFCNFRSDRARELSNAMANLNFDKFDVKDRGFNVITMTEYDKNLPLPTLFKKEIPKNILSEVISNNGLKQLHISETEKYAHVTFFFNGGVEKEFKGEDRILIPSPDVETYDLKPEMSAIEISEKVQESIKKEYDFIVVNFANGDMVGHTGNLEASIKAVETVDRELGNIIKLAKEKDYSIILTSDHGNCEKMQDSDGKILTNHTVGDVFCFIIDDEVKKIEDGGLNNIAPTILKLMNLEIPKEMDKTVYGDTL